MVAFNRAVFKRAVNLVDLELSTQYKPYITVIITIIEGLIRALKLTTLLHSSHVS